MKKILVTGGAGFVGRHTIAALLRRGKKVTVLDNFSCAPKSALKAFSGKIRLIEGDIRDARAVRRAVAGSDTVFHLAAIRSVAKSVEDPVLAHEVNATGALIVLNGSARAGVKHVLFTSTSAVYGEAIADSQKEEGPLKPISPYGAAKLAAEHYAKCFYREKGLPTTSVRIFNVYGPDQNPESRYSLVVPGVLSRLAKRQKPVIDGSGAQARDFVYIGDVLDAFFKILASKKSHGEVYNLGSGRAVSINTLVRAILRLTGSKLKPMHGPRRPGDPERTCADISKIAKALGWRPKVTLEEGLREAIRCYPKI